MSDPARKMTKAPRTTKVVDGTARVVRKRRTKSTIEQPVATVEQIVEAAANAIEQHLDGKLIDASTLSDDQILAYL